MSNFGVFPKKDIYYLKEEHSMVNKLISGSVILAVILFLGNGISLAKSKEIFIDTKIKPTTKFEEAKIKSVAIMNFDAKDLQFVGGSKVDYVRLSKMFADDIIKRIYTLGKIEVALGQYEDFVIETDIIDKKKGDLYINSSSSERSVRYNCIPFKKINAVLTGTLNKYRAIGDGRGTSFINITLKLTDSYDGTVYWITEMEGFYKDVIHTIAYTLSSGKYEEPVEIIDVATTKGSKATKSPKKEETPKTEETKPEEPKADSQTEGN